MRVVVLLLANRFSPSNFVTNWSTPQLIIHGSKDYRLPDTEGIGAFHALQQYVLNSTPLDIASLTLCVYSDWASLPDWLYSRMRTTGCSSTETGTCHSFSFRNISVLL